MGLSIASAPAGPVRSKTAIALRASIVLPTLNRRALLLRTLESFSRQSVDPDLYEVVVAVDGSTDGTVEALEQLHAPYDLRWIVSRQNMGPGAAVNGAVRAARHEVLVVTGDDMLADPDWIRTHLEAHERRGIVLVQGDYPLAPGCDRHGASLAYEYSRSLSMSSVVADGAVTWHIWAGNFSIRRQTYLDVGGFDESFREYGGEDTDFGLRVAALGIPFIFEPRARTHHLHAVTPQRYKRQVFSEGRAIVRVARKHGRPLASFRGSALQGPIDGCLRWGWRRSPRAMEQLGRIATAALRGADLIHVRPVQLMAARLVRRFYRVGGITTELQRA
jgi:GT2 family glycosyltransferase